MLDGLKEYLHDSDLLLVLDNFEHLMPAAAQVADLLSTCQQVKALVTSREGCACAESSSCPSLPWPYRTASLGSRSGS